MRSLNKLLGVALAATCAVNVCMFNTDIFIADAVGYSGEMVYEDSLTYRMVDENEDGTYDSVLIVDCDKSQTELVIPDEINGVPVTAIDGDALTACNTMETLTIGSNVASIEYDALHYSCFSLTAINVSENNSKYSSADGVLFDKNKTFLIQYPQGKKEIKYTVPNSVTEIGNRAFYECVTLENIEIADSVTTIGKYAFAGCTALKESVIPNGVTLIEDNVFNSCESLKSVTVPNSVKEIGYQAFSGCKQLSEITITDNVEKIGEYAFNSCEALKSINIPDGIKSIESGAFFGCKALINIKIPESVTAIWFYAFVDCSALTDITIENPECMIYDSEYTICSRTDDLGNAYFDGTIRGYTNSTAQAYAQKYGYNFESLGEASVTTPSETTTAVTSTSVTTQTTISTTAVTDTSGEVLKGDANNDGKVTVSDAAFIARKLAKREVINVTINPAADYNDDDKVTVSDAAAIARNLAKRK